MPIQKGKPWGRAVDRPPSLRELADDAAVASYAAGPGERVPATVTSGDLHRSLGSPTASAVRPSAQQVTLDLLRVSADGHEHVAAANVVARSGGRLGWWRGPIVAICNVDHLGDWNVAPKAHPNDGRFDVVAVDAAMSLRARLQARNRLAQGTHVPHPAITLRRSSAWDRTFQRPLAVFVDGRPIGKVTRLRVTIDVDAYELYV